MPETLPLRIVRITARMLDLRKQQMSVSKLHRQLQIFGCGDSESTSTTYRRINDAHRRAKQQGDEVTANQIRSAYVTANGQDAFSR